MMLVCSNLSEVTDGGSCLQASVTIEQYGSGGRTPIVSHRLATKLKNEIPSCRLSQKLPNASHAEQPGLQLTDSNLASLVLPH